MIEKSVIIQALAVIIGALISGGCSIIVELIRSNKSQKTEPVDASNGLLVPKGYQPHKPTKPKFNWKTPVVFTMIGGLVVYILIFIVFPLKTPAQTQLPKVNSPPINNDSQAQQATATKADISIENRVFECQQIHIPSCIELTLVTNPHQNICLNEEEEILISSEDIADLQTLSGRIDVDDCTCRWEWRAKNGDLMDEFVGSSNQCNFSIPLTDKVSVIYLMLTTGEQVKLFKILIQ